MSQRDYRGARGSNAGDDFHELWAVSQALTLLDHHTTLSGITVEGLHPEDEHGEPAEAFDGVDCAMFHGGDSVATAARIDIVQFKYSPSDRDSAWTVARLTASSAKTRDNSVVRRLADAFRHLRQSRNGSPDGIRLRLISNQPVSSAVTQIVQDISTGRQSSADNHIDRQRMQVSSGLKDDLLKEFASAIDFSQTGSRFLLKEHILKTISSWTEGDSRALTDSLLRFMREKMMPESKGEWIRRESILAELGFSDPRAIFPCPPDLTPVRHLILREASEQIVNGLVSGEQYVCIHGNAGCGKTTTLSEIERRLPTGSVMIVFDCYGGGRYLDSDAYRHRPKDAFLQLSNDLASRLHVPLLLTRSDGVDYPRAFHDRLTRAAEVVAGFGAGSLLVVAADAADNSVTAAERMVPPESSFMPFFVGLGNLPANVRLLVSARTGRLDQLGLPPRFKRYAIDGFTEPETTEYVRCTWKEAPDWWISDFHQLSGRNPRVQQYALRWAGSQPSRAREFLMPTGKGLGDVFNHQFEEARKKAGTDQPLLRFSAALSALPRPVPLSDLSAVSGLTEPEVTDICLDLVPGIRIVGDNVGFGDEDFETFVRNEGSKQFADMQFQVAERFMANRAMDPYAAMHVVSALYAAGRRQEILSIVGTEPEPAAIGDPLLRREVRLQRVRTAMQVCTETGDKGSMLRTLLVGAEAMHGTESLLNLVLKFPDLAAAFMQDTAARLVLQDSNLLEHHGPLLLHLFREKALNQNRIAARGEYQQLSAWLERRQRELNELRHERKQRSQDWNITAVDLAAETEGILSLAGPRAAIDALRRWRPHTTNLEVLQIVSQRLVISGRADILKDCLAQGLAKPPWNLFLLVPLALAGHSIDLKEVKRALARVLRRGWIKLNHPNGLNERRISALWLQTLLSACEVYIAKGGSPTEIQPILEIFADESFRQSERLNTFSTSLLDLQLRALALIRRLDGQPLTLDAFLVDPPKADDLKSKGRRASSSHSEELKRLIGPLISLYDARAQLLIKPSSSADSAALIGTAVGSLASSEYSFNRIHGAFQLRTRAAVGLACLRALANCDFPTLLGQCLKLFGGSIDPLGSSELAILGVFILNAESHDEALKILTERAQAINAQRTAASEKMQALLEISRFVAQISLEEAHAIFKLAHEATEEMDAEGMHQLRAVAVMAGRSAPVLDADERRGAIQALYSITSDAAVRLSNQEGFPWTDVVEALSALDLPASLACVARWQDLDLIDMAPAISTLIDVGVSRGLISATVGIGLLSLTRGAQGTLLESLLKGLRKLPDKLQVTAFDELARDALLASGTARDVRTAEAIKAAVPDGASVRPWLRSLENTASFIRSLSRSDSRNPQTDEERLFGRVPQAPVPQDGHADAFKSPEGLIRLLEDEIAAATAASEADNDFPRRSHFVSPEGVFERIRQSVPAAGRVTYLSSIAGIHSERVSDSAIAHSIFRAVEEWKGSLSVRAWCRDYLPGVITDRLPGFCVELSYGAHSRLVSLLELLAAEQVDVPALLAVGISRHVEDLSAVVVYELGRLIAERISPEDAAAALNPYLKRLIARIPQAHIDRINTSDVPTDVESSIARFLFALMSDCDVRIRWRAAHVLRRIAHLGEAKVLAAFLTVYGRTSEEPYRAPNAPFYWMAARLWWCIAVCRLAHELPQAVASYGAKLVEIAEDQSVPHVLIRSFAKDAALALVSSGTLKLPAARLKALSKANTPRQPRWSGKRTYGRTSAEAGKGIKDRAFQFDSMDTIPYWYQPALAMFADVTQEEFLDAAENWIVNKWHVTTPTSRWEMEGRKYRFSDRNWHSSSNDHGSEPTLERYFTYLERHAMFCAIGELIQSRVLLKGDPEDYESYEGWLMRRGLEFSPFWLVDFRGPVPLESRFWSEPTSEIGVWVNGASEADFIAELGIATRPQRVVVDAWHETRSSEFFSEAYVQTAFVEPSTAAALMRALQSAKDPYDYRLPDEDEEQFEIDSPPYRLLGWLRDASAPHSGIDRKDPFRNSVVGPTSIPGRLAENGLLKRTAPEGWPVWSGKDGAIRFEHEAWSTNPDDEDSERQWRPFQSHGRRLWTSVAELKRLLVETQMDLIVSVKLLREDGQRGYSREEKEKKRSLKGKILLLRANGDIEDVGGRIGTWETHRESTQPK